MVIKLADTKDRIIEAALQAFSQKGFAGTSTKAIATAAGVNEVTLFRHFGSKLKLLTAVVDRYGIIPVIQETLEHQLTGDYATDLKIVADHILDLWYQRKPLIMFTLMEAQRHPEETKALTHVPRQLREYFAAYLKQLAEQNVIRPCNFEATSSAFIGGLFSFFVTSNLFGTDFHPYSRDEYVNNLVDLFVAGTISKSSR
jgi:AcrR family transcriptional regulator